MLKKSLTFKQAFVVVLGLHAAGYFGITKWAEHKKQTQQARLERQTKWKQITDSYIKTDWPIPTINDANKFLDDTKTAVQPTVNKVAEAFKEASSQIESKTKNIDVPVPTKQELSKVAQDFLKAVQQQAPPKPNPTPPLKKETTETRIVSSKPVPSPSFVKQYTVPTIKQQRPTTLHPQVTSLRNNAPAPRPIISQKIYTINGVQYIETKRVISSHISL
jgi:hypothetical protein